MSIHIAAQKGQIADRILLPGDPLRAKFVAENYLEGAFCFNEVRNMFGYTGTYRGKPISVMGTGMGMPSLSIYVNELIREYDVNKLIRIGTCGSMLEYLNVRDIVLAMSACTDSAANHLRFKGMDYAPTASFRLLKAAWDAATSRGLRVFAGSILSSDMFYTEDPEQWKLWAKFGVLAVEMETAELYTLAAKFGRETLSVLTVSDDLVKGEITSAEERQSSFNEMVELALDAIFA